MAVMRFATKKLLIGHSFPLTLSWVKSLISPLTDRTESTFSAEARILLCYFSVTAALSRAGGRDCLPDRTGYPSIKMEISTVPC